MLNAMKEKYLNQPVSYELCKTMQEVYGFAAYRVVGNNSILTADHRPDRLNIEVDEFGIIVDLYTG